MLAWPVQEITAQCVCSPVFRQVYSFYSSADIMQIADPQGVYTCTRRFRKKRSNKNNKLFSQRRFEPSENLIQAQVLLNYWSPSHVDFILKRFLKSLPDLINLLDQANVNLTPEQKSDFTINVPRFGEKPYFVDRKKLKFIPRTRRKISKKN